MRWPDEIEPGWNYGVDLQYLRSFVDYWRDEYDWREHEAALNELTQYTVEIDSIDLHYIHVKGKGPDPMPLLLTHGWPSSFADFRRIIPMLTDPERFGADPKTRSQLSLRPCQDTDFHSNQTSVVLAFWKLAIPLPS